MRLFYRPTNHKLTYKQNGESKICGLIAFFSTCAPPEYALRRGLARMVQRGPDGEGDWLDERAFLGHRRLAILDLDARATQPMHSACGRYVIVFNGEIYNFKEQRAGLAARGVVFRTMSDTEVLLAMFIADGEDMLHRLHGMFAFVIWDRMAGRAFAARDPYGIKPLYVASLPGAVLLASQVKALLATGLVSRAPDQLGQAGFWMLGSVPEPRTWFRDVAAVAAGHSLWIENGRATAQRRWHDIADAWRTASQTPRAPLGSVLAGVRAALKESVARHLVADVPVGVFLSGGIDSSALAGLMVEAGARDMQGVTVGFKEFDGRDEDEVPGAALVAQHYGIQHHTRWVSHKEFHADIPRILDAMDQPSVDGVNTWYASKAAAEMGMKVVVSGVGGDELFQGYESFRQLPRLQALWGKLSAMPGAMTLGRLGGGMQAARTGNLRWRHAADWARSIGGAWWLSRSIATADELGPFMGVIQADGVALGFDAPQWVAKMTGPLASESVLALGQIESTAYLRNQLLRDSDWASMDHSVELRMPLVDAHLLNALQPYLRRFADFPGKTLLAEAPEKGLPPEIYRRRKTGFGIPVKQWLADEAGAVGSRPTWMPWMKRLVEAYDQFAVGGEFNATDPLERGIKPSIADTADWH